jgi:hypothetical protein
MNMPVLSQMEDCISHLSLAEQLWLMERLVQRIREKTINTKGQFESDLIAMANDPQIQNELQQIEEEFAFSVLMFPGSIVRCHAIPKQASR